ncbi:hypothetical protein BJ166DRAFT_260090 [Pestalotiopsis sp. NC0098]|nr:hypothetical protein BJ166DRAFT_260090 [Pestalotiopsis sp. NC0098]
MPIQSLPFVITSGPTGSTTTDAGQRRMIRNHVMRGKNRKKRPKRPVIIGPAWWIHGGNETPLPHSDTLSLPMKVGGEFSLTSFSADMTPTTLATIRQLRYEMFPIEFTSASPRNESSWFAPVWRDEACLRLTLYTTNTYLSSSCVTNPDKHRERYKSAALTHLAEALGILRKRLNDCRAATSDSTVLIVVGLALASSALGHLETAAQHVAGLQRMVHLRGGLAAFRGQTLLQSKICRADIEVALATGRGPVIYPNIRWAPCMPSSSGPSSLAPEIENYLESADLRLLHIWNDLSEFVRAANIAEQCRRGIDTELYLESMVSIHYRLVSLRCHGSYEALRLGLLGFASTLFLQWRNIKTRFEHLAQRYKQALMLTSDQEISIGLNLWLHMVGHICILDHDESNSLKPVLVHLLYKCRIKSWIEVRRQMKTILWIDFLHENAGKTIVEVALNKDLCERKPE